MPLSMPPLSRRRHASRFDTTPLRCAFHLISVTHWFSRHYAELQATLMPINHADTPLRPQALLIHCIALIERRRHIALSISLIDAFTAISIFSHYARLPFTDASRQLHTCFSHVATIAISLPIDYCYWLIFATRIDSVYAISRRLRHTPRRHIFASYGFIDAISPGCCYASYSGHGCYSFSGWPPRHATPHWRRHWGHIRWPLIQATFILRPRMIPPAASCTAAYTYTYIHTQLTTFSQLLHVYDWLHTFLRCAISFQLSHYTANDNTLREIDIYIYAFSTLAFISYSYYWLRHIAIAESQHIFIALYWYYIIFIDYIIVIYTAIFSHMLFFTFHCTLQYYRIECFHALLYNSIYWLLSCFHCFHTAFITIFLHFDWYTASQPHYR